jgi:hypothetical protein
MRVVVVHSSTQEAVVPVMDQGLDQLLTGAGSSSFQIVEQRKTWVGPVMNFSFTGRLGFISVPMMGTIEVDGENVTVDFALPPLLQTFVGEAKVRAIVEENVRAMVRG